MTKPDLQAVPTAFKHYVENVKDQDMLESLKDSSAKVLSIIRSLPEEKGAYAYAEGKWTIKEMLCHMIDAERIFAYRALRFARNDSTALPGFDENSYAPEANAAARTLTSLVREMETLRQTTIDLFANFTPAMLDRKGTASNMPLSVLTLGYIISGHETHHRKILTERYLAK